MWDFTFSGQRGAPAPRHRPAAQRQRAAVVWDQKTREEAVAAGRRPGTVAATTGRPTALEIKPTGRPTGKVVWEWHAWDHLVQDHDKTKANYGDVAAHPELIDVNFGERRRRPAVGQARRSWTSCGPSATWAAAAQGRARRPTQRRSNRTAQGRRRQPAQGRPGGPPGNVPGGMRGMAGDWTHVNSSTTTPSSTRSCQRPRIQRDLDHRPQHDDGRSGQPQGRPQRQGRRPALSLGQPARLPRRHQGRPDSSSPSTTPTGFPRACPARGTCSSSTTAAPRRTATIRRSTKSCCRSTRGTTTAAEPGKPSARTSRSGATRHRRRPTSIRCFISGRQRLPNGNTLICSGANGTLFEVTPEKEIVWKYVNPVRAVPGPGGPALVPEPRPIRSCRRSCRTCLHRRLSEQSRSSNDSAERRSDDEARQDAQRSSRRQRSAKTMPFGPGGPGAMPLAGPDHVGRRQSARS